MTTNHKTKPGRMVRSGIRQPTVLSWTHLMRIYNKVQQRSMAHLRDQFNLTPAQFEVLARVGVAGGLSQQELADYLLVTKGNVCGLINRMEEAGLVERRQDPDDRRPNRLHLTPAGRAMFEQVVPAHEALIAELLSNVPEADQQALLPLLRRLDRSLPDER